MCRDEGWTGTCRVSDNLAGWCCRRPEDGKGVGTAAGLGMMGIRRAMPDP